MRPLAGEHPTRSHTVSQSISSRMESPPSSQTRMETYARIGISEYCVFDPKGGMHRPRLQLFRLEGGAYERVRGRGDPNGPLAVTSETLGLELRFEDDRLRLWDPEAQEYLLEPHEEHARHLKERDKRVATEQQVRDLEAKLANLKERRPGKP